MKFKLDLRLKWLGVGLWALLLVAAALLLARTLTKPLVVEERIVEYSYQQEARVDYYVSVYPNALYPEKTLEPGRVYLANFLDQIHTQFTYLFKGERAAEIRGKYSIVAMAEAFTGKEKKKVWQREFVCLPETSFAGADQVVTVRQDWPLKLSYYNDFAKEVIKASDFVPDEVKLTVRWDLSCEAVTDKGTIKEQLAPTMVIPLAQKALEIGGDLVQEKPGALSKTVRAPVERDNRPIWGYGGLIALCTLAILFLLLFTTSPGAGTELLRRRLAKILKRYGHRLVAVEGEIPLTSYKVVSVRSLEDLVKLADELNRPIIYASCPGQHDAPSFYVFDEPAVFVWELKADG